MDLLRLIANILWLVLIGFWSAVAFAVAGVVMYILIVTIPFGIASFRIANYSLWPFGRKVVDDLDAGAPSVLGNIVWFVLAGIWIAIAHFTAALALMLTIIGIPFALATVRIGVLALFPLGKQIVPADA